jgi:hypothetical protein
MIIYGYSQLLLVIFYYFTLCHNPNLGLATKVRACKVAGQERKLGVKESVRE